MFHRCWRSYFLSAIPTLENKHVNMQLVRTIMQQAHVRAHDVCWQILSKISLFMEFNVYEVEHVLCAN